MCAAGRAGLQPPCAVGAGGAAPKLDDLASEPPLPSPALSAAVEAAFAALADEASFAQSKLNSVQNALN